MADASIREHERVEPRRPAVFRAEIQALRAIAVLGVVLYHLWPSALRGGFVGVDVFFVISGFLITQQLAAEAASRGRVSLTQFWARRIRRILPAAFTVLLASIAIVVIVMPRVTWQTNLSDIRAAAAYVENWQLGIHAVNYLDASNSPTVVQHYWSLSVEEQFYLVWPLVVILAIGIARLVPRARLNRSLFAVLGLAAVASFVTSVLWTASDPAMAFFATPTRAWEFAVGGLVAVTLPGFTRRSGSTRAALSWMGIALIGASMVLITRHDAFPGAIALIPVIGAALVVAADLSGTPSWTPARLLRRRAVQAVGDNSYSIYLWHWPLIIAAPWLTHGPLTWPGKVIILMASLGLAGLTKRFVEDPVRRGARWRARRWPAYALVVAGVAAVIGASAGFTADLTRSEHAAAVTAAADSSALVTAPKTRSCFGAAAMVTRNHCTLPFARPKNLDTAFAAKDGRNDPCLQSDYGPPTPVYCTFGQLHHPTQTIAVIGNSHSWRLIPALSLYAKQHHWKIIEISRINCLGLITTATGTNGASPQCLQWANDVEQHLMAMPHLTGVIFASYIFWQYFTVGKNATPSELAATRNQILAMWSRYREAGVRVFVVQDVPGMRPTADPQCIAKSRTRYDPCAVPRRTVVHPTITTVLSKEHPSLATYVPIDKYFCDARKCHALIGHVVVYFDSQHMTTTFARSMAQYLGSAISKDFRHRERR